jgi:uncharacterized membrane protein
MPLNEHLQKATNLLTAAQEYERQAEVLRGKAEAARKRANEWVEKYEAESA